MNDKDASGTVSVEEAMQIMYLRYGKTLLDSVRLRNPRRPSALTWLGWACPGVARPLVLLAKVADLPRPPAPARPPPRASTATRGDLWHVRQQQQQGPHVDRVLAFAQHVAGARRCERERGRGARWAFALCSSTYSRTGAKFPFPFCCRLQVKQLRAKVTAKNYKPPAPASGGKKK